MDQNKVAEVFSHLIIHYKGKNPNTTELDSCKAALQILTGANAEEIAEAIRQYKINQGVSMDLGELIAIKHQDDDWFEKLNNEPDFVRSYYERYLKYIHDCKYLSDGVIDSTKSNNELAIKYFADPRATDNILRKGLVVGDVQAGKTLNYIGLINLAIDCGYKNILVLTGTTEDLRKQTQERIDEGIVGCRSDSLLTDKRERCGVGDCSFGSDYYAITLTSTSNDFSIQASKNMAFKLSDFDKNLPKIFVLKKNAGVLAQVENMIKKEDISYLTRDSLLVIDDECDFASLNTKSDESPTKINGEIRKILALFSKATYVGYSATPFANIFVNPDIDYDEEEATSGSEAGLPDLFPSDFIVLLESPTNYIGAKDMFLGFNESFDEEGNFKHKGTFSPYVHLIGDRYDDNGKQIVDHNFLPVKHKKDFSYVGLADSLKKAIKVFLLSSCVYTLRGYSRSHRTMLINISRFNSIQEEVCHYVKGYVCDLKHEIGASIRMSDSYFNSQPLLSDLESIWNDDIAFSRGSRTRTKCPNKEYSFKEIKSVLKNEIDKFEVFIVNNKHKNDRFNYDDYKGRGLRGIIIGGFTLSRGLTLSGLMTSYYSRNASAYDTLVQMGRWFGYRNDYDDLVNIYMTQSSVDSFCAASDATEDLKVQFRRMKDEKKTPKEFGLMVREAPVTLDNIPLVTAKNKMKNTKELTRSIVLTGKSIDTSKILKDRDLNEKNREQIELLIEKLSCYPIQQTPSGKKYFEKVDKSIVCEFLGKLHVSDANKSFDCKILRDFIRTSASLDSWNVVMENGYKQAQGDEPWEKPRDNGFPAPLSAPCVKRSFDITPAFDEENFFRVGGGKNTIVNPNVYQIGLNEKEIQEVIEKYKLEHPDSKGNPGASSWLSKNKHPFLIVYPIDLKPTEKSENNKKECYSQRKHDIINSNLNGSMVYGFALGFPGKTSQILKVNYRINLVRQKELEEAEEDIDEDDMIISN